MDSPKWKEKRNRIVSRAGGYCESCDYKTNRFEVHHLTYDRFTKEDDNDLIAVCVSCHQELDDKRSWYADWKVWVKRVSAFMVKGYGNNWRDNYSLEDANQLFCSFVKNGRPIGKP